PDDIEVVANRRISCFIDEGSLGIGYTDRSCIFAAGPLAAENCVSSYVGAAVVWSLPGKICPGDIPDPGQARRLRKQCRSRIRIRVVSCEQAHAAGLARNSHECHEIVQASSSDTAYAYATIAVAVKNATFVIDSDFVEVE